MMLLVRGAGFLEKPKLVKVYRCKVHNSVGEVCGARCTDMPEHLRWHVRIAANARVAWCHAGGHEYLKGANSLSTLSCQYHIPKKKAQNERGKRMMSAGVEKTESIRQRKTTSI